MLNRKRFLAACYYCFMTQLLIGLIHPKLTLAFKSSIVSVHKRFLSSTVGCKWMSFEFLVYISTRSVPAFDSLDCGDLSFSLTSVKSIQQSLAVGAKRQWEKVRGRRKGAQSTFRPLVNCRCTPAAIEVTTIQACANCSETQNSSPAVLPHIATIHFERVSAVELAGSIFCNPAVHF